MQDSRVGALTFQPKAFTLTKIQGLSWFPRITPFPKSFFHRMHNSKEYIRTFTSSSLNAKF